MTATDAAFSGSIPQFYDRYGARLMFTPYADDMVARLSALRAGRLLETAAGTGIVTQALAARLPEALELVATDLNQPMLDFAAAKPGMGRVTFRQADATALPFGDGEFDAVVCQFGVMFFPDRVAGMREARRVLKSGGRFVFNVWDSLAANPLADVVARSLAERYPAHPSWFVARTPFGYADPDRIRADLRSAGFSEMRIETVEKTGHADGPREAALMLCVGSPQRPEIESIDPGGLDGAVDAVAAAIARRFGTGAFDVPLRALVAEATA